MDVRIDKLIITSEDIKQYLVELENLRDRIYQVKKQVDTMSLGRYGISTELEEIIGNIIQASVIMNQYHIVLNEAAIQYETTENNIVEKYSGTTKEEVKEEKPKEEKTKEEKPKEEKPKEEKPQEKKDKKKKSWWENAGILVLYELTKNIENRVARMKDYLQNM